MTASFRGRRQHGVKDRPRERKKCVKSGSMPDISLSTLGELRISSADGELALPTRKARALLVYLALSPGGSHTREHLAGMLWGRSAEPQARASLRQTLSSLRKALADFGDLLSGDAERVVLDVECIDLDLRRFEALAGGDDPADLALAAQIYRGDFLEGFGLPDEAFEEWLGFQRRHYRELATRVLTRLTDYHASRGEADVGLAHAQRLLAFDPLQERVHQRLMELYDRLGRREHALRQFRECKALLESELQVVPSADLSALYESIKAGATSRAADTTADSRSAEASGQERRSGKPAIAVLPFDNLSGDPAQQFLADAITEDLVSNLAHDLWFDVIARTSTLQFRDDKSGIGDIAERLGVRYLVDGSLRRADDRVRISVVLIDARDARQIWSRQYDQVVSDLFEMQEQIAISIAAAVIPELGVAEQRSAMRQHPASLDAWSCCHRAFAHLYTFELDELRLAQELFARASELDPDYSQPLAGLAYSQMMYVWYDSSKKSLLDDALRNARRAVRLDNRDSFAYFALGRVLSMQLRYDEAIMELETAIDLNPSFGRAYFGLASVMVYAARFADALEPIDTAIRLSPADPHLWTFYNIKSRALGGLGRLEEAAYWARQALRQPSATFWSDLALITALGHLGRMEEAREAIRGLQRKRPGYTCTQYSIDDFMLARESHEYTLEGLRRAGLPES